MGTSENTHAKMLSTDVSCRAAKPGPDGSQIDYTIKGERGLRLRVSANRHGHVVKSWSLLYWRVGDGKSKRCRVHLGSYPSTSLAQARAEARRRHGEIMSGADPAAKARLAKEAPTFGEMASQWLEVYAKQRRKSWRESERILNHDILPRLGNLKADDITKRNVSAAVGAVMARGSPIANRSSRGRGELRNFQLRDFGCACL